ncbi:response regulator transcription factor [Caballeronia sp. ATUFL_F1_KS4A]|uniref:response regulator n=1 Tax=Caballeronia sp. ATUFL_F1_KS4A TaxID=2921768 RepID=UPI0020295302|nr:response regulator transcription factor [Caballeronia sp. ATUFL_F1_KS4A]
MKALLVDNETLTREGFADLLNKIDPDLEVTEAESEEEMKKILSTSKFDIIFLDINLINDADGRGLELLKELKDNEECPLLTPIIMVSSRQDHETVSVAFKNGAYGYLPKITANREMARKAMRRVLDGEVYYPPPSLTPAPPPKRHILREDESGLTPRVFETLYYVVQGLSNKAIAKKMNGIKSFVVAEYVTTILKNFKVLNRMELMADFNKRNIVVDTPKSFNSDSKDC